MHFFLWKLKSKCNSITASYFVINNISKLFNKVSKTRKRTHSAVKRWEEAAPTSSWCSCSVTESSDPSWGLWESAESGWDWFYSKLSAASSSFICSTRARVRARSHAPWTTDGERARAGWRGAAVSRLKLRETTGLPAEETWAGFVLTRVCSLICPVGIVSISFRIIRIMFKRLWCFY